MNDALNNQQPPLASFAERLRRGAPLLGTFVFSPDAGHTEIVGGAGFDFCIVDMEHAPLTEPEVLGHVRASAHAGVAPLVRIGGHNPQQVARLLDLGAAGIVIPHAGAVMERTVELCRALRYPPQGARPACRGVRAAEYGLTPFADYVRQSDSETLMIGLIEDVAAVDDIDNVLASCPWDVIMPGPNDLAASLGLHGQLGHPRVREAVDRVLDAARRHAIRSAMYVSDANELPEWIAKGVNAFVMSIDYRVLALQYKKMRMEAQAMLSI